MTRTLPSAVDRLNGCMLACCAVHCAVHCALRSTLRAADENDCHSFLTTFANIQSFQKVALGYLSNFATIPNSDLFSTAA